jgi:hypothetical protein
MAALLRSCRSHMAISHGSGSGVSTGSRSTTAAARMRAGGAVHAGIAYSGFLLLAFCPGFLVAARGFPLSNLCWALAPAPTRAQNR